MTGLQTRLQTLAAGFLSQHNKNYRAVDVSDNVNYVHLNASPARFSAPTIRARQISQLLQFRVTDTLSPDGCVELMRLH